MAHNSRHTTFPTLTQRPGAVICYVMGEGKRVVFVHRGAGSTIGCLVGAISTSAGRGGTSDYISCLRCHRVSNGLLNDEVLPTRLGMQQSPSLTLRSRGAHRGWVPRYSAGVELGPPSSTIPPAGGPACQCLFYFVSLAPCPSWRCLPRGAVHFGLHAGAGAPWLSGSYIIMYCPIMLLPLSLHTYSCWYASAEGAASPARCMAAKATW